MSQPRLPWHAALAASLIVAGAFGCTRTGIYGGDPVPEVIPGLAPLPVTLPDGPPAVALPPAQTLAESSLVSAVPLIPFVAEVGGKTGLFVFDRTLADNYALPGAGTDIQNPALFSGNRIVLEREESGLGRIYFYDLVAELLVSFNDVNSSGSVRRPSISADGTVMAFLLEAEGSPLKGRALIWLNGVVADLAKVNAIGALHGGITWIRLSCDARWAVFTTADGRLFVYDVVNPIAHEITDAHVVGVGFASHPAVSPDGTQIAWADTGGRVFRYDRIADLVDPMPYLNLAFNNLLVTDPVWLCRDNAHILAELYTQGAPGVWRIVEYNWITETIASLTILNNVLGEGTQTVSVVDLRAFPGPSNSHP